MFIALVTHNFSVLRLGTRPLSAAAMLKNKHRNRSAGRDATVKVRLYPENTHHSANMDFVRGQGGPEDAGAPSNNGVRLGRT